MAHIVIAGGLAYPEAIRRLTGLAEGWHPGADRYLVTLRNERLVVEARRWPGAHRWRPRLLATVERHGAGCRLVGRYQRGVSDSVQIGLVLTWAGATVLLLRLSDRQNAAAINQLCEDLAHVLAGELPGAGDSVEAVAVPRAE